MMMPVRVPRSLHLRLDVDEIARELQVMVRVALQTICQTGGEGSLCTEVLGSVERERMTQLMRNLIVVIAELTLSIGAISRAEDIRESVEDFVRGNRQLTVQLQLIIVGIVHTADAVEVIARQAPAAVGGKHMLGVGLALRRNTVHDIHTSCSDDMLAHVQRTVVLAALDGRITFLQLLQPLGQETVPAYVTALIAYQFQGHLFVSCIFFLYRVKKVTVRQHIFLAAAVNRYTGSFHSGLRVARYELAHFVQLLRRGVQFVQLVIHDDIPPAVREIVRHIRYRSRIFAYLRRFVITAHFFVFRYAAEGEAFDLAALGYVVVTSVVVTRHNGRCIRLVRLHFVGSVVTALELNEVVRLVADAVPCSAR